MRDLMIANASNAAAAMNTTISSAPMTAPVAPAAVHPKIAPIAIAGGLSRAVETNTRRSSSGSPAARDTELDSRDSCERWPGEKSPASNVHKLTR
jgi:hypothetical protein